VAWRTVTGITGAGIGALVYVDDPEHRVVVGDSPDLLNRGIRVQAEVVAGLLRGRLGAAALAAATQILPDDLGPLLRGELLEADPVRGPVADDRLSRGCPDVADPLRLAGQGLFLTSTPTVTRDLTLCGSGPHPLLSPTA
jgi:hypothetical protein